MINFPDPSQRQPAAGSCVIRPEIIAGKLAAIHNLECPILLAQIMEMPRLVELLWFIQFVSTQLGGLVQFVEDLLEKHSEQIGTPEMLAIGKPKGGRYSVSQAHKIWQGLPQMLQYEINLGEPNNWRDFLTVDPMFADEDEREAKWKAALQSPDEEFLGNPAADFVWTCKDYCRHQIPSFLASVCNEISQGFDAIPCFQDIFGTLFKVMDSWAQERSKGLAQTAVTRQVFDALDYAHSEKVLVKVEGDSRFGKTESIATYCAMYPGRVRLVTVPCSNCDADLFRAVADALGIVHGLKTSSRENREKVEYVVRFGRLMIVLDEAHFLLPVRFSENTPPMRLNWVRTQIIDRKVPCVLVSTPQSYQQAESKYVRKTGYSIEQFLGRVSFSVRLPTNLSPEDLLAVARIHFPELDPDYLDLIAGTAMVAESYLKAVENISRRARFIAKRAGRDQIGSADVELAISEVSPPVAPTQTRTAKPKPVPTPKTSPATPLRPVFTAAEAPRNSAIVTGAGEEYTGRRELAPPRSGPKACVAAAAVDQGRPVLV